jgi:hypothetical protein
MDAKYQVLREDETHTDVESPSPRKSMGEYYSSACLAETFIYTISFRAVLLLLSHATLLLISTALFILSLREQDHKPCTCSTTLRMCALLTRSSDRKINVP